MGEILLEVLIKLNVKTRTQGSIELSLFPNCVQKPLGRNGGLATLCNFYVLLYNCITLYLSTSDCWFYQ